MYVCMSIAITYQEDRPRCKIRWLRMITNKVLYLSLVYRQIPNQTKASMFISAGTMINLVCPKEKSLKMTFPSFLFL